MKLILAIVLIGSLAMAQSKTVEGAKEDIATFKSDASAKLDSLEKQISELKEKYQAKGLHQKDKAIQDLEESRTKLTENVNQIGNKSQTQWQEAKKKISKAVSDLNAKIQKQLSEK